MWPYVLESDREGSMNDRELGCFGGFLNVSGPFF